MAIIYLPARINTGFGDGITEFFTILSQVRNLPPNEPIEFNMSRCSFLTPFFLLPMVLLIQKETSKRQIICCENINPGFKQYAELVSFYKGLRPENIMGGNYEAYLEKYITKSFFPIIDFPSLRSTQSTHIRDTFLGVVNTFLQKQLNLSGGILTGVCYLIDEAVNNIVDHSEIERGFIFGQYYPSRKYLDICIMDGGIGILETYLRNPDNSITTHKEAIHLASSGVSTKEAPEAQGRGFGISTSKRMLADGLDGKYFLMSGNAFLFRRAGNEQIVEIPIDLQWNGTIVALRVPYVSTHGFNPTDYYEI